MVPGFRHRESGSEAGCSGRTRYSRTVCSALSSAWISQSTILLPYSTGKTTLTPDLAGQVCYLPAPDLSRHRGHVCGGWMLSGRRTSPAPATVLPGCTRHALNMTGEQNVHNGSVMLAPVGCAGELLYQVSGICLISANSDEKPPGYLHGEFLYVRCAHDALMRSSYWHNVRVRPFVAPPAC